jgi:hypothetical protein
MRRTGEVRRTFQKVLAKTFFCGIMATRSQVVAGIIEANAGSVPAVRRFAIRAVGSVG